MRKSTHRYIAIAFGVAMLPITAIELLMGGFPAFGVICLAGAKQFYDNSIGRIYDDNHDALRFSNTSDRANETSIHAGPFDDYHGVTESWGRGDNPFGGGRMIDDD